jgi:hypothetical protein
MYFNGPKNASMKHKSFLLLIVVALSLCGCGGSRQASGGSDDAFIRGYEDPDPIRQSLFDSKDRTISEDNIQKLLNGKLVLPDTVRIALYQYSKSPRNRYYTGYSSDEDFLKAQQSFVDTLIHHLSQSHRVSKIVLIPSLMISSTPNITSMRETAVRLQADLLLVFSITSDLYYKYRVFSKDEAKAYATTECMVMDIRTALVPFSTIVTKDFYSKKINADANLEELRRRTERMAILQTLTETGSRLVNFMQ